MCEIFHNCTEPPCKVQLEISLRECSKITDFDEKFLNPNFFNEISEKQRQC